MNRLPMGMTQRETKKGLTRLGLYGIFSSLEIVKVTPIS
ncbi:conserved hypothetical protein [Alteromonas sp. 38]|nr:conserved hypothetical protein [Alteromonas sp. 154]VXB01232.1 conserved hypothetical protein [Alteromonas sp. 38]